MNREWLFGFSLLALGLAGCGTSDEKTEPTAALEPFELAGAWLYLGPSDVPHTLNVTDTTMVYADVDGKWSSTWTVKAHDNHLHRFQVSFDSGSGAYLPVGQIMSGSYDVTGSLLTTQLASGGGYPALLGAGSCTDASGSGTAVPDCRLYVKH